jgi:hypothetical protein
MSVDWSAIYAGPFHHPGLAFAFCAALAVRLWLRFPPSALRRVLFLFLAETALDAFFTGALSPFGTALPTALTVAFVILGDLRFFWLVERFRRPGVTWGSALMRAVPWAFAVPVATAAAILLEPDVFTEEGGYRLRPIFLAYEALFVALASALLVTRYVSRAAGPEVGWYLARLLLLWLTMYGMWVLSDALLTFGHGWALGLRMLPNALYYGVFLYAAAYFAPEGAWT